MLKESRGESPIPNSTPSLRRFFCMLLRKQQPDVPELLSVTVSSSLSAEQPSTSRSPNTEYESLFRYFDENCDGKVSPAELRSRMRTAGTELSAEEAEAAVESTDSDGDGLLGFEDFVRLVEVEGEEEKGNSLKDAFRAYVTDGQDCITAKSLRQALRRLGESKSVEECKVMIRQFDLNGDGVLSFEEFKVMML